MEVLEIEYLQTGELDSSLELFSDSSHRETGGKMRTAWKHPNENYTCGLWDRAFSVKKAKRAKVVMVESTMQPPNN